MRPDADAIAQAWADAPGPRALLCRGRAAVLAVLRAAAARREVVLLPASSAPEAVRGALDEAGAAWHDGSLPERPELDVRALPACSAPQALTPDDDARWVVLHTSGSSGAAKPVPKTFGQLDREARALAAAFDLRPSDRLLATVPPWHIYGLLFSVLLPDVVAAEVEEETPFFPDDIAARARGATALVTVPAHLRALADLPPGALPPLRRVFSSGAPLPAAVAEALRARHGWEVTEVLGSTETGGIAWRVAARDLAWRPLPGVRVEVDADERLWIDSPWLPPDAPRPWPTDDRARLHGDGATFEHLGRADDVVKVASKRVSVGALTQALAAIPGVTDAAVWVGEDGGEVSLHAAYVADAPPGAPDDPLRPEAVRSALSARFDPTVLPRLHRVADLGRAPTGKLPREALAATLAEAAFRGRHGPGDVARVAISVAADHPGFAGHFPDHPVLPAAIALGALIAPALAARWPDLGPPAGLDLATFHRPIRPGDDLALLARRDGPRVTVELQRALSVVLSAKLAFGP